MTAGTGSLISKRLRDMALRYDYEDRPLLLEAAAALERHLLAELEALRVSARPEVAQLARFRKALHDIATMPCPSHTCMDTSMGAIAQAALNIPNGALPCAPSPLRRNQGDTLNDGFGNTWERCGPDCQIEIVRPGKVQCGKEGCSFCGTQVKP